MTDLHHNKIMRAIDLENKAFLALAEAVNLTVYGVENYCAAKKITRKEIGKYRGETKYRRRYERRAK